MSAYLAKKVKLASKGIGKKSNKELADELRFIAQEIETDVEDTETETEEMQEYRKLLNKIKNKPSIQKFKIFIDNPRKRKPIRLWLDMIDKGEGAGEMDFNDMIKNIKRIIKMDLPVAKYIKLLLDYGLSEGYVALNRILEKGRAKITLLKDAE